MMRVSSPSTTRDCVSGKDVVVSKKKILLAVPLFTSLRAWKEGLVLVDWGLAGKARPPGRVKESLTLVHA